jgi:hypothetical protein
MEHDLLVYLRAKAAENPEAQLLNMPVKAALRKAEVHFLLADLQRAYGGLSAHERDITKVALLDKAHEQAGP